MSGISDFLIIQATDLLPDSTATLEHGLALALASTGRLLSLHIDGGHPDGPAPDAEKILARWSVESSTVAHDTVTASTDRTPRKGLLRSLQDLTPHLLIVGSRQQQDRAHPKTFRDSTAEVAALDAHIPTLVVHLGQPGLVDDSGGISLQRILVPVGDGAEARDAIRGLTTFLDRVGGDDLDIFLLRVGDDEILNYLTLPEREGWRFHPLRRDGFVSQAIADVCASHDIDLVAMSTRGQDGVIDVFSGTHTQKVIRRVPCSVLVSPVFDL
jgi:nucleotide-binding universal stress UspA family protein